MIVKHKSSSHFVERQFVQSNERTVSVCLSFKFLVVDPSQPVVWIYTVDENFNRNDIQLVDFVKWNRNIGRGKFENRYTRVYIHVNV